MMAARLEAYKGRPSSGAIARSPQGFGFRMGTAAGLGPAPPRHGAISIQHNATNGGIRRNPPKAPARQRQCGHHVLNIGPFSLRHH